MSLTELFGKPVSIYTRAQAIEDGVLVDVSADAAEFGYRWPVAMTHAAWLDCVAWTEADCRRQIYQDQRGRLHDVLYMAFLAIRRCEAGANALRFAMLRLPRDGYSGSPRMTALKLMAGPGDSGEPVLTIMLPEED